MPVVCGLAARASPIAPLGVAWQLNDPLAYRFLLARGQALGACRAPDAQERARMCLRAARELAGRVRDMDAVRDASAALEALPDWGLFDALLTGALSPPTETALTQEEIAHIIERERQNRTDSTVSGHDDVPEAAPGETTTTPVAARAVRGHLFVFRIRTLRLIGASSGMAIPLLSLV